MRNMTPAASVDAYLAALPDDQRAALQHLREVILDAAPGAAESISYGIPTFKVQGKQICHLGAAAKHCAFYPGAIVDRFAAELAPWSTSKGTVRFQPDRPLPDDLIRRMVAAGLERRG
jgi:uncharacterized protein YdhG (YjbR/CyaY superfamily)